MNDNPIGIFDSGIGGIALLKECASLLPHESFLYHADFENAPYGNKSEYEIFSVSLENVELLLSYGAKAIVVACNTATGVAVDKLRKIIDVPIIGLEPAVKPACEDNKSKPVVLLCTNATARQEKFIKLIQNYGNERLSVLPQENLAKYVEDHVGDAAAMKKVVQEIFTGKTDAESVVLGCSHYTYLKKYIIEFFKENGNESIKIYDGISGTAKQLRSVLQSNNLLSDSISTGFIEFV